MTTLKTPLTRLTLALGLVAVALPARADYTDNLLVGWTFNGGTLTSDLGTMSSLTLSEGGNGANMTTVFNPDGTLSIGSGRLLTTTGVNSTAISTLTTGFTMWARVRIDNPNPDNANTGAVIFGLSQGAAQVSDFSNRVGVLEVATLTDPANPQVRFTGRQVTPPATTGGAGIGRGAGWNSVSTAQFYDIAIRFADTGTTGSFFNDSVNGTYLTTTWDGATFNMPSVGALALGKLKSNAGAAITFDEVRLYSTLLSDVQIAAITEVSAIPEPSSAAVAVAGVALIAVGLRRRARR